VGVGAPGFQHLWFQGPHPAGLRRLQTWNAQPTGFWSHRAYEKSIQALPACYPHRRPIHRYGLALAFLPDWYTRAATLKPCSRFREWAVADPPSPGCPSSSAHCRPASTKVKRWSGRWSQSGRRLAQNCSAAGLWLPDGPVSAHSSERRGRSRTTGGSGRRPGHRPFGIPWLKTSAVPSSWLCAAQPKRQGAIGQGRSMRRSTGPGRRCTRACHLVQVVDGCCRCRHTTG
jgi:hypothetical protein